MKCCGNIARMGPNREKRKVGRGRVGWKGQFKRNEDIVMEPNEIEDVSRGSLKGKKFNEEDEF